MRKKYITPEAEIQKFTIFCDETISNPDYVDPGHNEGENEF